MKSKESCKADGVPVMMGKENGCSEMLKDENVKMLLVHCVIHSENLALKNI